MKSKRKLFLLAALMPLVLLSPMCIRASSIDDGIYSEQYEASGAGELSDALPDEVLDKMKDAGIEQNDSGLSLPDIASLFEYAGEEIADASAEPLRCCCIATAVSMICSLCTEMWKGTKSAADAAGGLIVCMTAALPVVEFISGAGKAIENCCGFTEVFIPVYAAVMTAAGQPTAAAGYSAFSMMLSELCIAGVNGLVFPLLRLFLALSLVVSVCSDKALSQACELAEKGTKWFFGLCASLLAGISAITSVTGAASDSATFKAARYVLSTSLPVAGSTVMDAASVVQGSISVLRSSTGAFGIVAIAFVFAPYIIKAAVWLFFMNISAVISGALGAEKVSAMYRSAGSVLSIVLSLLVFVLFLMVISAAMTLGKAAG